MKIESKFTRGFLSRLIEKIVRDKLGYDVDVQLNGLRMTILEDKTQVHLDVDLGASQEEVNKLVKSIGF